MKKNQRKSVSITVFCLVLMMWFAVNTQIVNAEQNTAMAGYNSDCKSIPEKISLVDVGSDVSKACVFFSSKTFTLNFPAYCNPVDIYFAILNPDNKLMFINSKGRMSLDFTPYAAGANTSINTSFSVANSSLAAEIYGKCVIYWFIAPANGGNILKSIEYGRYELGWYNTDDAVIPPAGSSRVPDTGVTKCYNNREEIPCQSEGEDFYGQDGNYSINPMSYTKLDNNGNDLLITATTWSMVRDNVTGLIWENNSHKSTWDNAPNVIAELNNTKFGGYSDWRLPTIQELGGIVDFIVPYPGPTINISYFKDTLTSFYWSSTTYSSYTSPAWGVDFNGGNDLSSSKNYYNYVRAVRGGQ